MASKDEGNGRQSPLTARAPEPEPDVVTFVTALKQRDARGKGRKSKVRPTEKRRRARRLNVTFSSADIPERLRTLAEQMGMQTTTGAPAVSRLVELLLLPQLEAAEQEQVTQDDEETDTGEQWF